MTMKGSAIIYIDCAGCEHTAVVTRVNPFEPTRVSLAYVDMGAAEFDNVRQLADVQHHLDASKDEPNPTLPRRVLNAWREADRFSHITDIEPQVQLEPSEEQGPAEGERA